VVGGFLQVIERNFSARVGEGIIYDLRMALFEHFQRMSLRFFTHTPLGEMISRLNNDVVDAQDAVNRTLVAMVTNTIHVVTVLVVMVSLEWRLALLSAIIVPLFVLVAQQLGEVFRKIARKQMEVNARMNAGMGETLNVGGALLIKLFGRHEDEVTRFGARADEVRKLGIQRASMARTFMAVLGLLTAIGTALVYGLGGWMVIRKMFTIGTIIAFGAYLTQLYAAFQSPVNAPLSSPLLW